MSKLADPFRRLSVLIETPVGGLQTTSYDRGATTPAPLHPTQLR